MIALFDFLEDLSKQPAPFKDFIFTYPWTGLYILNSNNAKLAARYLQTEEEGKAKKLLNSPIMQYAYKEYPLILAQNLGAQFSMVNHRVSNIVRYVQAFLEEFVQHEKVDLAQTHLAMIKKNCPQITEATKTPYLVEEELADYFFRVAETPNTINSPLLKNLLQFQVQQRQWTTIKNYQMLQTVVDGINVAKTTKTKV